MKKRQNANTSFSPLFHSTFSQSNDSSEETVHRSNITADPSPSEVTTDNENKHNSSEEAWTDVNLNEDGDTMPITNPREDPRNIHNIAHSRGKGQSVALINLIRGILIELQCKARDVFRNTQATCKTARATFWNKRCSATQNAGRNRRRRFP